MEINRVYRRDVVSVPIKRKRYLVLVICLMVITLMPVFKAEAKTKPKLTIKAKAIRVGDTASITLKNAGKTKWKSSNKSVIAVVKTKKNKATIKARKQGKAVITATYKGKKYKKTLVVRGKDKEKQDNPILNAESVDLYYLSDICKQYIAYNQNHLQEFRFRVSGTDKEVYKWSLEGEDASFFKITDYGLVTIRLEPSYYDWSKEVTVKATLEDGRVLEAKVTGYSEANIYAEQWFQNFENTYITENMTDLEKAEKAAWYIGATTDYEKMQPGWFELLAKESGDCQASRYLLEKMCRHMGVKACGCGEFDNHGQTLVKIGDTYYLFITGFDEPKPRSYMVSEITKENAEQIMQSNNIKDWMFDLKR